MKKQVFLILACLWIVISSLLVRVTYAKYLTEFGASTNIQISGWNIVLNTQDIMTNSDFSSNLTLTFPEETYHIADVIVPNAIGYFDLNLDISNVTLPFEYTITATPAVDNEIADIKIIGYSLNGNNSTITYLENGETEITGSLADTVNSYSVRVYMQWNDDVTTETLNDDADTSLALNEALAKITANVKFEQITN